MYHHVVVFSPHGGGFSPHGGGFFRDLFYFPPMVGAEFSTTHHGAESWLPNRWWFFPPPWREKTTYDLSETIRKPLPTRRTGLKARS